MMRLSREQELLLKSLREGISCKWNKKVGIITIEVTDQDPYIAALVAKRVMRQLQDDVKACKTQKAQQDLDYAERLYNSAQSEYQSAMQAYTTFSEQYGNATQDVYRIQLQSLEREMSLKFSVLEDATAHLTEAKAKLQENTPVFYSIQDVSIAGNPSGRSRMMRLLMWGVVWSVLSAAIIYLIKFVRKDD